MANWKKLRGSRSKEVKRKVRVEWTKKSRKHIFSKWKADWFAREDIHVSRREGL